MSNIEKTVAEIERLDAGSIKGPYEVYSDGEAACIAAPDGHLCNYFCPVRQKENDEWGVPLGRADADFYAAARTLLPKMGAALKEVMRLLAASTDTETAKAARISAEAILGE